MDSHAVGEATALSGRSVDRRKDFRTERKTLTAAAVSGLQAGIAACRTKEHTHVLQGVEIDNAPVALDVAEQVDGPSADPVAELGHPVVAAPGRAPGSRTAGMAVLPAGRVELRPPPGIAWQVTGPGDLAEAVERHRVAPVGMGGMRVSGKRAAGSLDLVQRGRGLRAEDVGGSFTIAGMARAVLHARG